MIRKLRRKFIAVSMISVTLVLVLILGVINVSNYINIGEIVDPILDILAENKGEFPISIHPPKNTSKITPETPYETRYFSVKIDSDGEIIFTNTGYIAAIAKKDANAYANEVFSSDKNEGFLDQFKYKIVEMNNNDKLIIFVDCGREFKLFNSFLVASIFTSLLGIGLVFILVLILSKLAVKPIAESYTKQKRFITDASHEIKTPLTIIDTNTEVLEMIKGENEWTKSIKNQIERLTSLANNLVSLSRMDENKDNIVMVDFSLSDAIQESIEPFKILSKKENKSLSINIGSNISLFGNESQIRQLVGILADNAIKYTNKEGIITIKLKKTDKYIELSSYNTVESIKEGNNDMLLERFYRADDSRNSETGGTGLGLSIARTIVENHNGKITVTSEDGKSIIISVLFKNKK